MWVVAHRPHGRNAAMQDAIRADRYLTILSRLTGGDLLRDLWPVVVRLAWLIFRFRRGAKTPEAAFAFEVELQSLLREVGRLIVQWSWEPQRGQVSFSGLDT